MAAAATPLRIGLIGLSSSAKTSWAVGAHLPYLLSEQGRSKYRIVALLNSSVDAAKKAISQFNLPAETKAYGDPESLAADPDVDFVVCNTRVDKHYETILPSVKAGKAVYSEWPLAQDAAHARELVEAAKASGSRTLVGLQGRLSPVALRVRELIEKEARIGKVLSSELRVSGGTNDRLELPTGLAYFADRKIGGNIYTIGFGHLFDLVQSVLGELTPESRGHFQLQRPNVPIRDRTTNTIVETIKSTVPDLVVVTGRLPESGYVAKDATFLARQRKGQPFPGEPALSWTIVGEKGEIRLVSQTSTSLSIGIPDSFEVYDYETGKVENVEIGSELGWKAWQEAISLPSRNVGALYEAFADPAKESRYATFESATKRHEQLERLLGDWQA